MKKTKKAVPHRRYTLRYYYELEEDDIIKPYLFFGARGYKGSDSVSLAINISVPKYTYHAKDGTTIYKNDRGNVEYTEGKLMVKMVNGKWKDVKIKPKDHAAIIAIQLKR